MIQKGSRGILSLPTPAQLRAARGLLSWSQTDLARSAGLSLPTVKRVEGELEVSVTDQARGKLRSALEAAGIVFIEENGGGVGVRLKKSRKR